MAAIGRTRPHGGTAGGPRRVPETAPGTSLVGMIDAQGSTTDRRPPVSSAPEATRPAAGTDALDTDTRLALTGERTVPGIPAENYWFRRHEVAYRFISESCRGKQVLEAGSGEGYGGAMLAAAGAIVTCVDYDASAVEHTRRRYPEVTVLRGNLVDLPLPDQSVDVVVNFQVIEHLWDQAAFIAECHRVLRPGGRLLISTPNRITFSPGRDTPLNPFHTRELDAAELTGLLIEGGLESVVMHGVYHGDGLTALDSKWGGSLIDAQIERALAGEDWPGDLVTDVAAISVDDFVILDASADGVDIDASLDLFAVAVRP
ncbi:putative methyltransferase [Gordonia aichiensis NBRC 108223]|uniref:Putative methyltransferase n=2 Tax=Gordonia aichiensis TaxID=36820 RepID=L7KK68_9ACTN|nr:putative methyltransferase [Gordonia aichiensis NBRC 108223]